MKMFYNTTEHHFKVWGIEVIDKHTLKCVWGRFGVPVENLNEKIKCFRSSLEADKYRIYKLKEKDKKNYKTISFNKYKQESKKFYNKEKGLTKLILSFNL